MEDNVEWKCIHLQESERDELGRYDLYGNNKFQSVRDVELTDGILIELCPRCYAALEQWVWDNR